MEDKDLSNAAYSKMARLCARAEYCKADIYRKLYRYENINKAAIIARLIDEGFIDEARYAKAYVHDKILFNHWTRQRIEYELHMRHISQDDIDEAFNRMDNEDRQD